MPATHSKKVETEACLPLGNHLFFKLHFAIIWELKIPIVAVFQVEFLSILGVYKTWSPFSDSPLCDAPYIFNRRQIWTAGRPVKHMHSMPTRAE